MKSESGPAVVMSPVKAPPVTVISLLHRSVANLLVIAIVVFSLDGGCSMKYLFHLAVGQIRLLMNRTPLDDYISRTDTDGAQRRHLQLIREMTVYARETLGLSVAREYSSICTVDVLIYVITAAPKDRLEPVQWYFPITGAVSYLGFFRRDLAEREIRKLTRQNYDISLRQAAAYSTLGWFSDPVFLSFLSMTEEQLARLIFHELAHRTVFIRGETDFNESFATFVGYEGSRQWLKERYGPGADAVHHVDAWVRDRQRVADFVDETCRRLDDFYRSGQTRDDIIRQRPVEFSQIAENWLMTEAMLETPAFQGLISPTKLNNALILALRNYDRDLELVNRFHRKCGRNLKQTITTVKKLLDQTRENPVSVLEMYLNEGMPECSSIE